MLALALGVAAFLHRPPSPTAFRHAITIATAARPVRVASVACIGRQGNVGGDSAAGLRAQSAAEPLAPLSVKLSSRLALAQTRPMPAQVQTPRRPHTQTQTQTQTQAQTQTRTPPQPPLPQKVADQIADAVPATADLAARLVSLCLVRVLNVLFIVHFADWVTHALLSYRVARARSRHRVLHNHLFSAARPMPASARRPISARQPHSVLERPAVGGRSAASSVSRSRAVTSASASATASAAQQKPPAQSRATKQRSGIRAWSPSSLEVRERHLLIRRLVWLDTEGQLKSFARTLPWAAGEGLQAQLRSLQHRSPLLHWHFKWNWGSDAWNKLRLNLDSHELQKMAQAREAKERAEELRGAIRTAASPAFFSLVGEASRLRPSAAPGLSRRVAYAAIILASWRGGQAIGLSDRRRYKMMNAFLQELVHTMDECYAIMSAAKNTA